MARVFPVEFALHFIKEYEADFKIVLFSEDTKNLQDLRAYFNDSPLKERIFLSSDLSKDSYTKHQKDLFDLYLMSFSAKIIAPSWTSFSTLASCLGNTQYLTIDKILSAEKRYELIEENFNKLKVNNFQKAASQAYLYTMALNLKKDYATKKAILLKAFECDESNFAYANKLLEEAFKENNIQECESLCEFFLDKNPYLFSKHLFAKHPSEKQSPYAGLYELFKKQAHETYPHICYVAGIIYEMQKDSTKALSFYNKALKSAPNKRLFNGKITNFLLERLDLLISITNAKNAKEIEKINIENLLKEKEREIKKQLSYRLGAALLKAFKSPFKLGLLSFIFVDAFKIYKDFKAEKARKF